MRPIGDTALLPSCQDGSSRSHTHQPSVPKAISGPVSKQHIKINRHSPCSGLSWNGRAFVRLLPVAMSGFGKAISARTETQLFLILLLSAHGRTSTFICALGSQAGGRLTPRARRSPGSGCFSVLVPSRGTRMLLECFLQHAFYLVTVDPAK